MKSICPKVRFHPLLYFFSFLAILTARFQEFLTFMFIIFIHECGHYMFSYLFHWKVEEILFLPFGGMIKFKEKLNRPIYQEFFIALGGPLFQIILYQFYPTKYHYPLLIFNLLPIYPLDGSKFLFLLCNLFISYYKSYWVLFFSSYFVVIVILIQYPSLYIVIFGSYLLIQNVKLLKILPDIFLTFLFERYKEDYFYYREIIIKGKKYKKMKRSVKYIFFYNNSFYSEREILKQYFQ